LRSSFSSSLIDNTAMSDLPLYANVAYVIQQHTVNCFFSRPHRHPYFSIEMKTSRPVEVLVLAVQEEDAQEEREYHEVDPEVLGRVGERVVVFEPAEVGQQILPIMPLDFLPGDPT